ncbi:hypothetical protein I6A60_40720 [Frankia sp. AgB1.9]|uniref:hypothetical protein n=1 Tax=unclassified Frankia TaxID=2632575 RepID=UPI001934A119|nr:MULTISPECIES: hypothetical protein [unclassified Frankia]MBL7489051.1 hypothetical protein [Frankia sp. AgW1.1]MBL7554103.1 hypothetical protein [Frankia sp. AgB1.9]MBL7618487.1 hypothetical protein [Frankia sp. AgB1.8]
MVAVVAIPADPRGPARVEAVRSEDVDPLRRLVGGDLRALFLDEDAWLLVGQQPEDRDRPVNTRARLLRGALDPDSPGEVICGDAVVVGPGYPGATTAAPGWLRDFLADPPGLFGIEREHSRSGLWEATGKQFGDVFEGLAVAAIMTRLSPRTFRLTRIPNRPTT